MSLSLNCLIHGDDPTRVFTVEIEKTDNVIILRDLIKKKKAPRFDLISASDLDLWKVSESFLLRDIGQKDVNDECEELWPGDKVSAIFEKISENCLHVIAKPSTGGELIQAIHRSSFPNTLIQALAGEQGKTGVVPQTNEFKRYNQVLLEYARMEADEARPICDGRRVGAGIPTTSPPIYLYHPIFGRFIHMVEDPDVQPTVEDLKNVAELMYYLSLISTSELAYEYAEGLHQRLHKLLRGDVLPRINSDGTISVGGAWIQILILELQREMGEDGPGPTHQASLRMKRSWISPSNQMIRKNCCCPTFLISGAGPWLGVSGAVFTDRIIVQHLTEMRWMALSSTEEDAQVYRNARLFIALRKCLEELGDFYRTLPRRYIPPSAVNQFHFPYPNSFTREDSRVTHFQYISTLEDNTTYLAEIIGKPEPKKVVVKFVARYGKAVHELLAQHGYAPKLLYCGPVPGDPLSAARQAPFGLFSRPDAMHMVVMEYFDARSDKPQDRDQIEEVLWLLHTHGYVFGDLREPNVLYDQHGDVKFINFNWCGRYDTNVRDEQLPPGLQEKIDNIEHKSTNDIYVCYPLSLSTVPDMWAPGIEPLVPIRPQHDWKMLDKLCPSSH